MGKEHVCPVCHVTYECDVENCTLPDEYICGSCQHREASEENK